MSDGAPDAAQKDVAQADAAEEGARDALVMELGAGGRGRAEIALALGMSLDVLAAEAAGDAMLAMALSAAAGLEQAWWERLAREACEAGRFSLAAWGREMRRRFGEGGPRSGPETAPEPAPEPAWKPGQQPFPQRPRPGERAIYILPCSARTKKRPDGTCACGGLHNDEYWRLGEERFFAKYPEQRPAWKRGG